MSYRNPERVKKVLAHKEADRVPYMAGSFDGKAIADKLNLEGDHREFCIEGDFKSVQITPDFEMSDFTPYFDREIPDDARFNEWGIGEKPLKSVEGYRAGNEMFYPLTNVNTLEELKKFPFPDFVSSGADIGLEQKTQELKDQGFTVVGGMSRTILETAYDMREIPKLMMDFYERPEYIEYLFERIFEQRLFQARRYAEAGVDILGIGDDIASQAGLLISPEMYRERIKPLHAAVIAEARKVNPDIQVNYHSDGNLTGLLPDLIDIGVTCINPVQAECMDLAEVKKEFGKNLTLWGCMPVQSIFPHGSRDDIKRHIEFLMNEIAVDGGLVINFINFLPTETSMENAEVFIELFYEMGRACCTMILESNHWIR